LPCPEVLAELNGWLAEHHKGVLATALDAASSLDADSAATNCESQEDELMLIQSMQGEEVSIPHCPPHCLPHCPPHCPPHCFAGPQVA
jgi:hypothetical protein